MFGSNIRVFVPQLAMSGGTMLSCLGKEIFMGKQSSIGPIDPQINGLPAHGVKLEFDQIVREVTANPTSIVIWKEFLKKYHPTFILMCDQAIRLSGEVASLWLKNSMFANDPDKDLKVQAVLSVLNSTDNTLNHARHLCCQKAQEIGLKITPLEQDPLIQDAVLSIHHSYIISFSMSLNFIKIIENNIGKSFISQSPQKQQIPIPFRAPANQQQGLVE
jgi:hypothetical protein